MTKALTTTKKRIFRPVTAKQGLARSRKKRAQHPYGQAKTLTPKQFDRLLTLVTDGGYNAEAKLRDEVMVRLSYNCGLRVCEMANIKWKTHLLDADGRVGEVLHISPDVSKRVRERFIVLRNDVREVLKRLRKARPNDVYVIHALKPKSRHSQRAKELDKGQCHPNSLTQYWIRLYRAANLDGCSSHSGRRTLITTLGQRCNEVNASLRDVQLIAGHASLETTQGYLAPVLAARQRGLMGRMY